jgi:hypothetical protein
MPLPVSRPPDHPLIAYLVTPTNRQSRPLRKYQFSYLLPAKQPFQHFYFLF